MGLGSHDKRPRVMIAYPQATEAQREVLEVVFTSVTDFTFEGLYGLDSILAGRMLVK